VESLRNNCCIIRVQDKPYLCNPLSVVANTEGKLRLALNLKYLKWGPAYSCLNVWEGWVHVQIWPEVRLSSCWCSSWPPWVFNGRLKELPAILFLLYFPLGCPQLVICLQSFWDHLEGPGLKSYYIILMTGLWQYQVCKGPCLRFACQERLR